MRREAGEETDSNTNLFDFSRHGLQSTSVPEKEKLNLKKSEGDVCVSYVPRLGKKKKSSLVPPLVSSPFPCLFTWSFPSVRAEVTTQTKAAILCSAATSSSTVVELHEVTRGNAGNEAPRRSK